MNDFLFSLATVALGIAVCAVAAGRLPERERVWVWVGFVAAMSAAAAKVVIVYYIYRVGDFIGYVRWGGWIADWIRSDPARWLMPYLMHAVDLARPPVPIEPPGSGPTAFMFVFAALFQVVFGTVPFGMSLFVAVFGFAGKTALYHVLRDTMPPAYRPRVAAAVYLIPSFTFWSNGFSKEGIAVGFLGWALYGYYQLSHAGRPTRGLALLLIGSAGVTLTKPYVLFPLVPGLAAWEYWRRSRARAFNPFRSLAIASLAGVVSLAALTYLGQLFPRYALENIVESSEELHAIGDTVEGGSNFSAARGSGLGGALVSAPSALVAALYRPFIFEAHNAFALVSALESSLWLVLTLQILWTRRLGALRTVWTSPVLVFCAIYVLTFGFATGYASMNLGTLGRYRSPMLPFLGVLFAALVPLRRRAGATASPRRGRAPTPRGGEIVAVPRPSPAAVSAGPSRPQRPGTTRRRPNAALIVLLVTTTWGVAACGSGSGDAGRCTGQVCADATEDADGAGTCGPGVAWATGSLAFRDATEDWGLAGVEGTRLAVGDIDGDGWADLLVRRGGGGFNAWADGTRNIWLLRNDGGTFVDITQASGIDDRRFFDAARGRPFEVVAFADVDNDGDVDVYTGQDSLRPGDNDGERSEIMLNNGAGVFSFTAAANPLRRDGEVDVPASATFTDVDRDGNIDIWVPQHDYSPAGGGIAFAQDRLYRGRGDGTFDDVTDAAGLATQDWGDRDALDAGLAHTRAWSGAACDLNGDGNPELLAASYGRAPNHLWQAVRNNGGGVTFANRSIASGYAYDGDQRWQDNEFARCYCASNADAEGCADAAAPQIACTTAGWRHTDDRRPYRLGGNSGTTVCGDLDNDGDVDLLTTEVKHWWAGVGADATDLLFNAGGADVVFDRTVPREDRGLVVRHRTAPEWDEGHMTAATFDFDNDGWLDLYLGASDYPGNHGLLFHQQRPGFWQEVPVEDGIDHNRSHGVAVADYDRDGDLDVILGHSRARCDAAAPNDCYETMQIRAFENVIGDRGNWVQLVLEGGPSTNRAAIGARVTVVAGDVTQQREVEGGHGHFGMQHDRVVHVGLGSACTASITVRWPDAALTEQRFEAEAGARYTVVQGAEPVRVGP